jgi:hypothetical protein
MLHYGMTLLTSTVVTLPEASCDQCSFLILSFCFSFFWSDGDVLPIIILPREVSEGVRDDWRRWRVASSCVTKTLVWPSGGCACVVRYA